MKQSFLSTLENKYYYAVSRYFWHIVIAMGILGIGAGILVYFWTLIPPSKREVVKQPTPQKPNYPDLREVTIQDIIQALPKKKEKVFKVTQQMEEEIQTDDYEEEQDIAQIDSAALATFNRTLGQTKMLIPVEKNKTFWQNSYKKEFKTERDRKMYRKTHDPRLYQKVLINTGFKTRFIKFSDKQNVQSYYEKANLLDSYNQLLKHLDSVNRIKFIENTGLKLPVKYLGTKEIDKRLKAIGSLINKVPADEQLKLFNDLWYFIKNNPNDGVSLIDYLSGNIDQVPYEARTTFIKNVLKEYIRHYNNNPYGLKEATNHFIDKITNLEPDRVPIALKIYYRLYRQNNSERAVEIAKINQSYNQTLAKIDREYQQALAQARADYIRANHKKKSWREWSYKGIFAGFISLLLFSLVLLILSMIRNVNRLTEAMYEQNHSFQDQINRFLSVENKNTTNHKADSEFDNLHKSSEDKQ